ncbi:hypothetical protein BU24DRAFT_367827 [Aaosphaeria arxii CBS 175.79]|uniref:FAD dependent oxidoreductase domain-containing protein n=1 Tax=Aaosphaeria arxii CBS 175.79 TaxID=1450172 RepID=A0A6A5XYM8_9PLEO|nr:uncharacterized protein BU24DRAFT_367827 [Aaosphaeria arxii CBS 175.79]KAF2017740.1 hypothetical protein BU24DRAFT_367827 [Aaosphaeria arxii CBS 175.79]
MSPSQPNILIIGAGVIGLTNALVLREKYPTAPITIVAKHFPGDRSIEYTSPWAGANWCSMAHDNGLLEQCDRISFERFKGFVEKGLTYETGVAEMGLRAVFDAPIEQTGIITEETGKVWYDELVGGLQHVKKEELPSGATFAVDFPQTFHINTQTYLGWLQNQALSKSIRTVRRHLPSLASLLSSFPSTTILLNCTALGSYSLTDVRDLNLYPTRGQTVLVAEPATPIPRMYLRSPARIDPSTTYVFPRPHGGGVVLGGCRQDGNWSADVDPELAADIVKRCCALCPELGRPEDLQVISHNVGLRPGRKGGPRMEVERRREEWGEGVSVVHCYGHAGAGYQASWGVAEHVAGLVQKTLEPGSKL